MDPKKLKAMVDASGSVVSGGTYPGTYPGTYDYSRNAHEMVEHAAEEMRNGDALDDASDEAKCARKISVGYMEISDDAGGFSCGSCRYAVPGPSEDEGTCLNQSVRAEVSMAHGCCNLFWPHDDSTVTFPAREAVEDDEDDLDDSGGRAQDIDDAGGPPGDE